MILSMTGYGKASCELDGKKITVEIKSLNSKQMDISMRLANSYRSKELEIRTTISQKMIRGKVDCAIYFEDITPEASISINQALMASYCKQIKQAAQALDIPEPSDWMKVLLKMPDVLKTESQEPSEQEWLMVLQTLDQAIAHLFVFRQQEGIVLEKLFCEKIASIQKSLEAITPFEEERVVKIKTRLEENLKELENKITLDRNRLEQELIFYIEKLDINEEKVRLRNHLTYFLQTMQQEEAAGKKLGFICQEIGREINTIGSKSNQSDMQQLVVQMKDELEQMKEQVLNVL